MNGQSRETGNMERTSDKTKTHKTKNTRQFSLTPQYAKTKKGNASNINKTCAGLQRTGG
jgi:hypothetical protein